MFRFTDLINDQEAIEDIVARHPATREVFDAYEIRRCCWNCSVRTAALRGGIDLPELLDQLNRAVLAPELEQ